MFMKIVISLYAILIAVATICQIINVNYETKNLAIKFIINITIIFIVIFICYFFVINI